VKISFVVKRIIATDVLLFFTEFCLYNKQKNTWVLGNTRFISRVEHDISHSFAALTREISCSTLEINLVFPRTHVLFSIYQEMNSTAGQNTWEFGFGSQDWEIYMQLLYLKNTSRTLRFGGTKHEQPIFIWYKNSSRNANVLSCLKRPILWVHWWSNFKNKHCLSRENQSWSLCKSGQIFMRFTNID
jgi:hypothetical protein